MILRRSIALAATLLFACGLNASMIPAVEAGTFTTANSKTAAAAPTTRSAATATQASVASTTKQSSARTSSAPATPAPASQSATPSTSQSASASVSPTTRLQAARRAPVAEAAQTSVVLAPTTLPVRLIEPPQIDGFEDFAVVVPVPAQVPLAATNPEDNYCLVRKCWEYQPTVAPGDSGAPGGWRDNSGESSVSATPTTPATSGAVSTTTAAPTTKPVTTTYVVVQGTHSTTVVLTVTPTAAKPTAEPVATTTPAASAATSTLYVVHGDQTVTVKITKPAGAGVNAATPLGDTALPTFEPAPQVNPAALRPVATSVPAVAVSAAQSSPAAPTSSAAPATTALAAPRTVASGDDEPTVAAIAPGAAAAVPSTSAPAAAQAEVAPAADAVAGLVVQNQQRETTASEQDAGSRLLRSVSEPLRLVTEQNKVVTRVSSMETTVSNSIVLAERNSAASVVNLAPYLNQPQRTALLAQVGKTMTVADIRAVKQQSEQLNLAMKDLNETIETAVTATRSSDFAAATNDQRAIFTDRMHNAKQIADGTEIVISPERVRAVTDQLTSAIALISPRAADALLASRNYAASDSGLMWMATVAALIVLVAVTPTVIFVIRILAGYDDDE